MNVRIKLGVVAASVAALALSACGSSSLSGDPGAEEAMRAPLQPEGQTGEGVRASLTHRTRKSGLRMAAAFDHLVQRGFSVVRIWVAVTNIDVLSRLTALGFRPVAQRFHPHHGQLEEAFVRRLD